MAEITKLWIADKMRAIMKHKPIDKIRVTEICKAADIERPTFYYHFKNKYDLVAWMFCTDAYGTDITSVASAAAGMNRMKQEILFYKRAYEDSSQNALWHYMVEYFTKRYTELAKEKLGNPVLLYGRRRHDAGVGPDRQHHFGGNRCADDVPFHAGESPEDIFLRDVFFFYGFVSMF